MTADRTAIRAELEDTRAAYHALLAGIAAADWNRPTGNGAWNVRQVMWHLAWVAGLRPSLLARIRRGKNLNPPEPIFGWLNVLNTRWTARGASPTSAARKYDASHAATLRALDTVVDDEWDRAAVIFGGPISVEDLFRFVPRHFEEHAAQVRAVIRDG